MTTRRRFWVEVTPRFATPTPPPPTRPAPAVAVGSPAGPVPRLTELAVAAGLEGAELDAELASVHRQRASLAAYEAGLIERKATLGAQHPLPFLPGARTDVRAAGTDNDTDVDPALQAADDFLPDEVAVLLNMSVPTSRHHVDYNLSLVRQLPVVWHALADQRIDDTRARVIVRSLGYQATAHGGPVPDGVIDDVAALGVAWAARGCAPTTLRERLDAALVAGDPTAADRRRELRKRAADVTASGTGDGLAELKASQMDAADATLVRGQLDAYARRIKADGDERPIGAIRVAVLAALVTRPWEQQDPAVAHVTINADLPDLDLPDLRDLLDSPADHPDTDHTTNDVAAGAPQDTQPRAHRHGTGRHDDPLPDAGGPDATGPDTDEVPATDGPGDGVQDGVPDDEASQTAAIGDEKAGADTAADESATPRAAGGEQGEPPTTVNQPPAPGTAGDEITHERDTSTATNGTGLPTSGSGVGHVGGLPVTPAAVRALLQRIDALGLTHPDNGTLAFTITGQGGRLLAVATPDELAAAARTGAGLGPPPPAAGYTPTAAQYRYLRARDRHCRFPGCRAVALACDADHVTPYNRTDPNKGGTTWVTNLTMLCRHHHRLKTHSKSWLFRLDPDGTLYVTTPGGATRTTRPPAADQILDLVTDPPPAYDLDDDPPPF